MEIRSQRPSARRIRLAALMVITCSGLAGCSLDVFLGGSVAAPSYPSVSVPAPTTGSPVLPPQFPREVPVIPGNYLAVPTDDGSVLLGVIDVGPTAVADAGTRLVEAGYRKQELASMVLYLGTGRSVILGDEVRQNVRTLWYTVRRSGDIPGIPTLPTLTVPPRS